MEHWRTTLEVFQMVSPKSIIVAVILIVSLALGARTGNSPADSRKYFPDQVDRDESSYLHRDLDPGEAYVWYLGGCGFAVRTQHHLLIFDYQEKYDEPGIMQPELDAKYFAYV